MLTKKQTFLYWKTWAAICAAQGWERSDNQRRYAFHLHCHCPQSMRDFGNRDFSRFLEASAPLRDLVDIRDRDRENALHTIRKDVARAGFSDPYIRRLSSDLYGTTDFERLPITSLENLRNVIHNRCRLHARHTARTSGASGKHTVQPVIEEALCPF